MPWKKSTLAGISAELRQSAQRGKFVPGQWIADIKGPNGAPTVSGCGWGLVGWIVAKMQGGAEWARIMLPAGCEQEEVNEVLMQAGLTESEIRQMTPANAFTYFDRELWPVYENRQENWQAYITQSMLLAEYFISVLERVPVEGQKETSSVTLELVPGQLLPWTDQESDKEDTKEPVAA